MNPGEVRGLKNNIRDHARVTGDEVDDPRGQAGLLQQAHHRPGAAHGVQGRLPQYDVTHENRGGNQVSADGREVERRDGVDETLKRPIVGLVPHARVGDGLFAEEVLRERHIEAEKVGQFARRVDLGLVNGLGLSQHGGRVDLGPVLRGEQIGGPQEDRRAFLEGPRSPVALSPPGRVDGGLDVQGARLMAVGKDVLVMVGRYRLDHRAGLDVLAVDHHRNLDPLCRHRLEPAFELGPLRASRGVGLDGFVPGLGGSADGGDAHGFLVLLRSYGDSTNWASGPSNLNRWRFREAGT